MPAASPVAKCWLTENCFNPRSRDIQDDPKEHVRLAGGTARTHRFFAGRVEQSWLRPDSLKPSWCVVALSRAVTSSRSKVARRSLYSCYTLYFRRWRYYEDRARRNLRNRAYNIFMKNKYKKAMKKVLRYTVELEYGDKQPASHQEVMDEVKDMLDEACEVIDEVTDRMFHAILRGSEKKGLITRPSVEEDPQNRFLPAYKIIGYELPKCNYAEHLHMLAELFNSASMTGRVSLHLSDTRLLRLLQEVAYLRASREVHTGSAKKTAVPGAGKVPQLDDRAASTGERLRTRLLEALKVMATGEKHSSSQSGSSSGNASHVNSASATAPAVPHAALERAAGELAALLAGATGSQEAPKPPSAFLSEVEELYAVSSAPFGSPSSSQTVQSAGRPSAEPYAAAAEELSEVLRTLRALDSVISAQTTWRSISIEPYMPVNAMYGPGLVFSVKMYPLDKKEPTMVCVGGRVDHLARHFALLHTASSSDAALSESFALGAAAGSDDLCAVSSELAMDKLSSGLLQLAQGAGSTSSSKQLLPQLPAPRTKLFSLMARQRLAAFTQTCVRNKDAVALADLWCRAADITLWPSGTFAGAEASRLSLARRLRISGAACRYLSINCMVLQSGDLNLLSACCRAVEMLQLRWLGPEMSIEAAWLSTWALCLRRLTVQFWYDDCLGSPPVMEVTSLILETCQVLEDLCITGIDWPRAKFAILRALQTLEKRPLLKRLSLEGSQGWHEDELRMIKAMIPRVDVTNHPG
eukprot:s2047_g4.t1